jgi:hypothetical protein
MYKFNGDEMEFNEADRILDRQKLSRENIIH